MAKTKQQDICRDFGQAVRKRRLELGLSQEQLAAKAKLNRTYIGDIERGTRNVALRNIQQIAGAMNVSIAEFFATYLSNK